MGLVASGQGTYSCSWVERGTDCISTLPKGSHLWSGWHWTQDHQIMSHKHTPLCYRGLRKANMTSYKKCPKMKPLLSMIKTNWNPANRIGKWKVDTYHYLDIHTSYGLICCFYLMDLIFLCSSVWKIRATPLSSTILALKLVLILGKATISAKSPWNTHSIKYFPWQ